MDPAHEQITRLALSELRDRGFVLSGGQAFNAHGLGTRPSQDIDLFTNQDVDFDRAVDDLRRVYEPAGYRMDATMRGPQFAHIALTDADDRTTEIDMGRDYRSQPPVEMDVGPVLDVNDAVGGKLRGIYDRTEAKDFLDVQDAMDSGWSRERLLAAGDALERDGFDRSFFADQLDAVNRLSNEDFATYGASPERIDAVRTTMTNWAAEVRARQANPELDENLRLAQSGVAEIGQPGLAAAGAGAADRRHSPYERDRGQDGPQTER